MKRIGSRRNLFSVAAIVIVGIFSLIISAIPAMNGMWPHPGLHDEYAYVLQGDTFAHGRLTNPPHPMWRAFETFHVIQQPTYAAKFPPGQGMTLALGEIIWQPILGAWLNVAAGCCAITWLLLAFFPWRWALLGGLLAASSYTAFWWAESFWGGGVAMTGGALLGGAAARIVRRSSVSMGIVAAVGMGILANSRPFEGLVYNLLLWLLVLIALRGKKKQMFLFWRRVAPVCSIVMLIVFAWMGYYNWRVTGKAWEMPYVEYQKQYAVAPLMYWQKPSPPPVYRQAVMRKFHAETEYQEYMQQKHLDAWKKIVDVGGDYMYPRVLAIGLIFGCLMIRRSRAARWAVILCVGLFIIQLLCTPWMRVQYMAPAMGFFYVLVIVGMWRLSRFRWEKIPAGKIVVAAIVLIFLVQAYFADLTYARTIVHHGGWDHQALVDQLEKTKGVPYLVIVYYSPEHPTLIEQVYNAADIDSSQVVFAHDLGSAGNLELMKYFRNRIVLYWDVDHGHVRNEPPWID